jgi:hypothetical protein
MATTNSKSNTSTDCNSITGGVIIITIPNPAEDIQHDESQPCRSCLVQQQSGTQVYLDIETEAAAATGWKLSATSALPIPIDDVQKLHFFGTAGDIVQILWRD